MTRKKSFLPILILAFLSLQLQFTIGQVRLPKLVSNGMVLQRDAKVKIWGWASANETIEVKFMGATYHTQANPSGEWELLISNLKAGGPFDMEIKASNTITVKNILIGDVWLCSGQSNMELSMERASPIYGKEIAESENQNIRQFTVPQRYNFNTPETDLKDGTWVSANPKSVLKFSAVAYFFAKEIYDRYKVPVGLINASLGGSPAEAWMSEEALKQFPDYYQEVQKFKDSTLIAQVEAADNVRIRTWYVSLAGKDEAYKDPAQKWLSPDLNTSNWQTIQIPGLWTGTPLEGVNGAVWFRKKVMIPASLAGKSVKLTLGRIVDADSVFVNGKFIGTTSYQYPPRRYTIPENILKEGENFITVKLISNSGTGGFVTDKVYEIVSGDEHIDLKGAWQFKIGATMEPLAGQTFVRWKPAGLFNAMIHPLLNYAVRGAIWYQGESNAGKAVEYRKLFPAMIEDWRTHWKQDNFPFIFAQLPNFMEAKSEPAESDWAMLREAQAAALSLPQTGMAVNIDLGEWNDIHPLNKKDVAKRLALAARKVAYGEKNLTASGPVYKSFRLIGNRIEITFDNAGKGLVAKGGKPLKHFAITGPDGKFVWASAEIKDNKVIVWNDNIKQPVDVRYAWADNPEGANLYNQEGLPARPFRIELYPTVVQLTAEQDHQLMMDKLGIKSIRRGADGNPNAPYAANADESKAKLYTSLPDPLTLKNGTKITSANDWWNKRRPEIAEDFDREVYGRFPSKIPAVNWEVVETKNEMVGDFPVITKKLLGHVDNSNYPLINVDIQFTLTIPAKTTKPVPVIIEFGFGFNFGKPAPGLIPWQQQILQKGWGYAVLIPPTVQADNGAGLTKGIIGLVNKGQPRNLEDWGALKAWAWGAGRALDYLETDKAVDAKKVAIEGLSRYGKAALVTLAYDNRFALGFIGSSGAGGAKIMRRDFGEKVENLAGSGEYHWMAGNYIKYAGPLTLNDVPVDGHELIALCAPRPVFIGCGSPQVEGNWLDDKGMFMAAVEAGPVYRLLGKKDLGTSEMPPMETALVDGDIAFRQHSGGHTNDPNWATFLTFAEKYFNK